MANLDDLVSEQARLMGIGAVPVVAENDGYASTDGQAIYVNPSFISSVESSSGEGGVRFVLGHEDLHTTIVGTSKPEHLSANVTAASRGPLPPELRREAKRRIAAAIA